MQVIAEGVQERLGRQLCEHALHVRVIGAPTLDLSPVVSQTGHQGPTVRWASQSLVVRIQDADVATVAVQGVEHAGTCRR